MKFAIAPIFVTLVLIAGMVSCQDDKNNERPWPQRNLSESFKAYWFSGKAEITSYNLEQWRYGESRKGTAVLIYVTEDFLPKTQVKADKQNMDNIPVIKLNSTKKFITGIYPYSIMQSIFFPLEKNSHALKVSASVQEWCGQVYMQLNNRDDFEIQTHSYFEGEADMSLSLDKEYLENEIWTQLRIDPDQLPVGELQMIPSFEFIRLNHIDLKPYCVKAEFYSDQGLGVYRLTYPSLKRTLKIYYQNTFPFKIEKWEESVEKNGEIQVSSATKIAEIKSAYWNKNSNNDLPLRNKLGLD